MNHPLCRVDASMASELTTESAGQKTQSYTGDNAFRLPTQSGLSNLRASGLTTEERRAKNAEQRLRFGNRRRNPGCPESRGLICCADSRRDLPANGTLTYHGDLH